MPDGHRAALPLLTRMETVASGNIRLTWDAAVRLATIRFEGETHATGRDAAVMVDAMTGWIGTEGEPFGLLGDGGNLSGLDAEYRSVWGSFFRQHRGDSSTAFFNMGPVVRLAAEMFRIGTGLQLKAFANEEDARAWLRQRGIGA
ncbi:MAG: hypothetical protein WD402_02365 [Chloroflexota bacterium]